MLATLCMKIPIISSSVLHFDDQIDQQIASVSQQKQPTPSPQRHDHSESHLFHDEMNKYHNKIENQFRKFVDKLWGVIPKFCRITQLRVTAKFTIYYEF